MNPEDIQKEIEEHLNEINYDPGWFLGLRAKRLGKQSAFVGAQVDKIRSFILAKQELQRLQRRIEEEDKLRELSFGTSVQQAITLIEAEKARRKLLLIATDLGMTLEDYSEVQKQKALVDVEVDKAQKMVDVEVDKHKKLKQVDFEYFQKELTEKLTAALAYEQIAVGKVHYLLNEIGKLKDALYQLYFSGKPIQLIEAKAKDYQVVIEGWEKQLERHLQGDNGEDAGRGDENPFRRGLTEPEMADWTCPQF